MRRRHAACACVPAPRGRGPAFAAIVTALLCIAGAGPSAALADDAPADPDLSIEDTHRAGPFRIRALFRLSDVGYDDNVRFESQQREGDTTASAGAGLRSVLLWGKRGGLNLVQEADYVAFAKNTDLNHLNGALKARGIFLFKHAALSLGDRYDSLEERPNTEVDQRLRRKNNTITASARTLSDGRLALQATLRHEKIGYSSDEPGSEASIARLGRDVDALTLGAEVKILPKTTLTIEGVAEEIDFVDDSEGRDSTTRSIIPGLQFDPSASIQGFVKIGVKSLEAEDRPQDDTDVTVGEVALSFRMGGATRFKGTYSRDLVFSTLQENLYYEDTSWTAACERYLSRRLRAEIRYGRGLNEYPKRVTRGGTDPFDGFREDDFTRYGLTIGYKINAQLGIVVAASRVERDATDDFYDRSRNLYTIGSTYEF